MRHELKLESCYYIAALDREKTFEVRYNGDRGFQKGDVVKFREYKKGRYTLNKFYATITYVTNYHQKEDWVVFGFRIHSEE